jgi:Zn-dependent protease with chaperone function
MALAVSGIPLSVMISPLLVALAAVPVYLVGLAVDLPEGLTAWFDRAFHLLPTIWTAVRRGDLDLPWYWLAGLLVVPGLVTTLLFWTVIRLTFGRTGVGGVLRRMEARPPRSDDLSEQRLANLVEEVAVAAGVPPPRVLLIDTPAANAGAAGLSLEDAAVVVTRGFIERLPRDAQQAILAHVIASVGNGDLRVAAEILALLQTWGLITLLLEAPFLASARESLQVIGEITALTLRGRTDRRSRELALDLLLEGAGHEIDMDSEELETMPNLHPLVLLFFYAPFLATVGLAAILSKTVIWLTLLLTGPFVSFLWRTRRRLADAVAVQLTRHPAALAAALRSLGDLNVQVPGAVTVHFLFPIWDSAVDRDQSRKDLGSVLLRMQLPLESRLERLERLGAGAGLAAPGEPLGNRLKQLGSMLLWLTLAALLLGLLLGLNLVIGAAELYAAGWLLRLLLVGVPHWIARLWT